MTDRRAYMLRCLNPTGAQHGVTQGVADLGKWAADVVDNAEVLHGLMMRFHHPSDVQAALDTLGKTLRRRIRNYG